MFLNRKIKYFKIVTSACFVFIAAACQTMPEGDAANGERWFKLNRCNGCHGENGSGGRGPVIAGTSLSFNRFLNKLRAPDSSIMPAFDASKVPDKDAGEIYLWLLQQNK